MTSVLDFQKRKNDNQPISVITCYDYWSACIIEDSDIDAVLVGDSVSMVMHGFESTVSADMDMMRMHVAAVRRGLKSKMLIADMPFLAHQKGINVLMENVEALIKEGAQSIKIEGAGQSIKAINHVTSSGVPVMGHLGLTPQSIHKLGGYKVQGKQNSQAKELINDAKALEEAGCFAIVLELVPAELAKRITDEISIPTIGIGAGRFTSGQVLVLHDMLGTNNEFKPKFLRKYMNGFDLIKDALNQYSTDVKGGEFPNENESF